VHSGGVRQEQSAQADFAMFQRRIHSLLEVSTPAPVHALARCTSRRRRPTSRFRSRDFNRRGWGFAPPGDSIPSLYPMKPLDIAYTRLHNLRLAGNPLSAPEEVVRWLGAVQSQDYGPAKWAVGERTRGATDASLDAAFSAGAILRTHVLRPTWHFVHPADIRWLQALTAPRVHATNASMYRQTGVDDGVRRRSERILVQALRGGNQLTRKELEGVLAREGITARGIGMGYILMRAELDCVICSGALKGKQHTYALLEERVPDAPVLSGDEALAELCVRYFTSHGPATEKDLRWWSSLTLAQVRRGIEAAGDRLRCEVFDGVAYWSGPAQRVRRAPSPKAHLLQGYDEYFVGYGESRRFCYLDGGRPQAMADRTVSIGALIIDTQLAGHWKRTIGREAVSFDVALYAPLDDARVRALQAAADAHGAFLGRRAAVETRML
jgi:Winged helix DNA-binding domain